MNKPIEIKEAQEGSGEGIKIDSFDKVIDPEDLAKIQTTAKMVGGDFSMNVGLNQAGGGSFFNRENNQILLDPLQILEKPEQAISIPSHEGGHRAITLMPTDIGRFLVNSFATLGQVF